MTIVAVDTSVLLAILKEEPAGPQWLQCLRENSEYASLVMSSVAVAETRSYFQTDEDCRDSIRQLDIQHSPLSERASLFAGTLFQKYRLEGGPRKTILPDFLIAAHAAIDADALATMDRGYLRPYFPKITLLTPR